MWVPPHRQRPPRSFLTCSGTSTLLSRFVSIRPRRISLRVHRCRSVVVIHDPNPQTPRHVGPRVHQPPQPPKSLFHEPSSNHNSSINRALSSKCTTLPNTPCSDRHQQPSLPHLLTSETRSSIYRLSSCGPHQGQTSQKGADEFLVPRSQVEVGRVGKRFNEGFARWSGVAQARMLFRIAPRPGRLGG